MLVLLDSTVLIDYLRGRLAVARVERLETLGDVVCTTAVNVEEVYRGLRPEEADRTEALVQGLVILPLGLQEGRRAGTMAAALRIRGKNTASVRLPDRRRRVFRSGTVGNRESEGLPHGGNSAGVLAGGRMNRMLGSPPERVVARPPVWARRS